MKSLKYTAGEWQKAVRCSAEGDEDMDNFLSEISQLAEKAETWNDFVEVFVPPSLIPSITAILRQAIGEGSIRDEDEL